MRNKTLIAATLAFPLLVMGCDRSEQSPTASRPSEEKQAMAPSSQDKLLESAPPAAGSPASPSSNESSSSPSSPTLNKPSTPPSAPSASDTPAKQQSESKTGY